MCIYLRGSKAAVTEQFLYSIEIGAIIGQVCGKTVTQYMGAAFFNCSYQAQVFFHKRVHPAWR